MFRKSLMLMLVLVSLTFVARADMAPPKGYTKININFVVETNEDLSDYRFFFNFAGALEEVEIKSKGNTNIAPIGGGARYATGNFVAIPRKNLESFGEKLTEEQLDNLSESVSDKKIEGLIELGAHTFTQTVKIGKGDSAKTYIIERKNDILQMSAKKKTPVKKKVSAFLSSEDEETVAQDNNHQAIGGIFLSLFFLSGGVFTFRKFQKKG
jgi:hypothetical protein